VFDIVPGSPFAGLDLDKPDVERLALYYQLPLPSNYIALPPPAAMPRMRSMDM